ncbi:MAG: hypothetical protein WCG98_06025 [bacterium]
MLKSNMLNPSINEQVHFQTQTFDIQSEDISYVTRDFGDGTTTQNQSLLANHTYTQAGKKAVVQTIALIDGKHITNIITLYVQDKSLLRSFAIVLTPDKLIATLGEKIQFFSNRVGDSWEAPNAYAIKLDQKSTQKFAGDTKLPLTTMHSYFQNGRYQPEIDVFLNQCSYLKAQATISIHGTDMCLQAKIDGTLNKLYTCDRDRDNVPDICDDDIDGDGIKNLIGIISYENKDCSITPNNNTNSNINQDILQEHFQ